MKKINLLLAFLLTFFVFYESNSQSSPNCDSLIYPPYTDDMFFDSDNPCNPLGGLIFTYEEFQALSNGITTDNFLGVIDRDSLIFPDTSKVQDDNIEDFMAGTFGNLTLEEVYDCLDIGCSPFLDSAQHQLNFIAEVFGESLSQDQIDSINAIYDSMTGVQQDSFDMVFGDIGNGQNGFSGLQDSLQNWSDIISDIDIDSVINATLGFTPSDCEDSIWDDLVIPDSIANSPYVESIGGAKALKTEMKKTIVEALSEMFNGGANGDGGDPNWFLGEIEGLGMSGANQTMPSPSSAALIESVQAGVNLYNGSGNLSIPLDNISVKDISVPIGVNGNPGGLKVDDQQGVLGSNMNLSSPGKITRVVKGLPDDFKGEIDGYGYGYKRGLAGVMELYGFHVGVDAPVKRPKWLRKIICRIINVALNKILKQDNGIFGSSCTDNNTLNGFIDILYSDSFLGTNEEFQGFVTDLQNKLNNNQLVNFLANPTYLVEDKTILPKTKLDVFWEPLSPNYLSTRVTITIKIGAVDLVIGFSIRGGMKVTDVPSDVEIKKNGIGYNHLTDSDVMDDFGLEEIDINNFFDESEKTKLELLNKVHATKKRDEIQFFSPKAFGFLDMFYAIGDIFNTSNEILLPRYETDVLDLEPDEYYYDFGGYSGKFYFQPNGEIVLVPYQDFKIETEKREGGILTFTFTTPEGVKYTFDKQAISQHNHYTLPTYFRYPEKDNLIGRKYFDQPKIAKVEYPAWRWFMGTPFLKEVRKDYITNYYIERAPSYTSSWHVTEIESLMSKEKVSILYENDKNIYYNSSKNWTHTFPQFANQGDHYETKVNTDISLLDFPTEWKNGFADLTYSVTEANTSEPYISQITNHRGKVANFYYGIPNKGTPGGELCSKIEIEHNGEFYKGWEFLYSTPAVSQLNISCLDTSTVIIDDGQGAAYSEESETTLNFTKAVKDENIDFIMYVPITVRVICVVMKLPIRLRFPSKDNDAESYYMNKIQEVGSLIHLKKLLDLDDGKEWTRYQAEKERNFLFRIRELNASPIKPTIASIKYNGDLSQIPKRFSFNQDIWGNYNGISPSGIPFIKEGYDPILPNGSVTEFNTDHFIFSEVAHPNASEGRNWKSNIDFGIIGQIDSIILETGAFIKYNYDLHEYPLAASGLFSDTIRGGLRVQKIEKGSSNGVTNSTEYRYSEPTVVNFPIFSFQHEKDTYYKGLEQRVKTSWAPLNQWQQNKGGAVGYGKVEELYKENGRIEHIFTTPNDYVPETPDTYHLYAKFKRQFIWNSLNGNNSDLELSPYQYHTSFAPLFSKDWKFGLEKETKVFDEEGFELSATLNTFQFKSMQGSTGSLSYPKSNMYQYLHYGSESELEDAGALFNIVDGLTKCQDNLLFNLIRFIVNHLYTEHPYRYIEKDFLYSKVNIQSEKVEILQSTSISYFKDQSQITTTSDYLYHNDNERKILNVSQSISSGVETKQSSTSYFYADDYMNNIGIYSFLDPDVLTKLDQDNNYESPIHSISKVNNVIVEGSFTDLYEEADGRFLIESLWGYREGSLALTGRFLGYEEGMPTKYKLAKYGTGYNMNTYGYFPEITMTWNDNLLLASRTMSGFTTSNNYNDLCQLINSTDVNGLTTTYEYDERRRLEVVTSPGELQKVTTEYVMNPLTITTTTDFNDTTTLDQIQIQEMDGWGNLLATKRQPEDATLTTITYDHLWRPIEQFQLGNGTSTVVYEPSPLGRVSQTIDAVGNISEVEYLGPKIPDGVLDNIPANHEGYSFFAGTKTTDPNGHISYNWSDAFGKGTIRVSGAGGVTITNYDERERVSKIFNPIGEVYEYEYNKFTGQLATKKIPHKATEQFWYDESMRMVAKTDGDHHIILDYDDIYRLQDMHTGTGVPSQDPINGIPLAEESVNSLKDGLLLQNEYFAESTWMEKVTEGILRDGGVNGTKTMVYDLDDYGRVENVTSTYYNNTDQAYTVKEIFTPLTAAGLSPDVKKIVTSPSDENVLDYQYTFDKILRTTHTRLKLNDPSSPGVYKNIEQIVFNDFDQIEQKLIGATNIEDQYLQTVDYTYDDAGKLIAINDPLENGCVNEIEVCQLFWGSAASGINLEEEACGMVRGIILDGTLYEFPNVIHPSETETIELLINTKLNELNHQGTAQVHYQSFAGISTDFHISIMKTDLTSAKIMFENATDFQCAYELTTQPESCCTIIAIGQDGGYPLAGNYQNSPDLFFEQITYDGMDISLIEMAGSCTAGFIRNHYQYDADHRLMQVQNELFNPELIGDALSTAYTYDLAGNIMSLKRNGWVPEGAPGFTQIDNLTYTYKESTDPLLSGKHTSVLEKVEDIIDINAPNYSEYAQPHGFGKLSDVSEYTHDDLGRLIEDTGKGLTNISYNLLNLPETISINNGSIDHQYTFGGEKIKKSGAEGDRYYIEGIEYNENGLEFISIPNGRVLKGEQYQYNLTDHLGNVVVMFEDANGDGVVQLEEETNGNPDLAPEVLQRNHYYSFGMRVESPGLINIGEAKNKYLYNGKEIAADYGLNWHYYGFRSYDAAIGRFPSIDPIADNFAFVSGYNYAENNVPMSIDLWGLQKAEASVGVGVTLGTDGAKFNLNFTTSLVLGNFKTSYGVGLTLHDNLYNTGKGGLEIRNSFSTEFDNNSTKLRLATNLWDGIGEINEFQQRTGFLEFTKNGYGFSYENDGSPFELINLANKSSDSYRTAAASIILGDASINMNLFTGLRNKDSFAAERNMEGGKMGIPVGKGKFGESYTHGFVAERGTRYRYGGLTLNYGGFSIGVDSDRWVRHPFQNVLAHDWIKDQRMFEVLSGGANPVFNMSTNSNTSNFTLWGQ